MPEFQFIKTIDAAFADNNEPTACRLRHSLARNVLGRQKQPKVLDAHGLHEMSVEACRLRACLFPAGARGCQRLRDIGCRGAGILADDVVGAGWANRVSGPGRGGSPGVGVVRRIVGNCANAPRRTC